MVQNGPVDFRQPSPFLDQQHGSNHDENMHPRQYARHFASGAEDAAHELERSILGDFHENPDSHSVKRSGKGREIVKRPPSDTGSDPAAPPNAKETDHASKRRKLDNRGVNDYEPVDTSILSAVKFSSMAKGKGKQLHREVSLDSISVAPKSSRKKGMRKKPGLGPELELELGSHPPTASGDATPAISISRPPSPAHTTSNIVYELDEPIPSLKRAKKVDDSTMGKRIKALEEAQRKVWTNIAKRDVAKVIIKNIQMTNTQFHPL